MLRPSSGGRTPDLDPALNPLHDRDQYHPGSDDGEHSHEYLIGLEARAGLGDHGAEARVRGVDFADDDADHGVADRKPQYRQQQWEPDRQDEGSEQPALVRAEAS